MLVRIPSLIVVIAFVVSIICPYSIVAVGRKLSSSFLVVGQECVEVGNTLCSRSGTLWHSRRLCIMDIPVR